MGRGHNTNGSTVTTLRPRAAPHAPHSAGVRSRPRLGQRTAEERRLGDGLRKVASLSQRANRAGVWDVDDYEGRIGRRSHDLDVLSADEQRELIRVAVEAKAYWQAHKNDSDSVLRARALEYKRSAEQARELFFLCHTGFIRELTECQLGGFEGRDDYHNRQALRQACLIGLNKAIDRYDPEVGADPLTYAKHWMRAAIRDWKEREGSLIHLKHSMQLAQKVQAHANRLRDQGREVTVAELARLTGAKPAKVLEVFDFATKEHMRLDAPVDTGDGSDFTLANAFADPDADVDTELLAEDAQAMVARALSETSARDRRVFELSHGLGGDDDVKQVELFNGVYLDEAGTAYSAEPTVIAERAHDGQVVQHRSQRELDRAFKAGEMRFLPGTPQAHELTLFENPDAASLPMGASIGNEQGDPLSSGRVQYIVGKVEARLTQVPELRAVRERHRYRGPQALANSEMARQEVREALVRLGAGSADEVSKLRPGKAVQKGERTLGPLDHAALRYGLVDAAGNLVHSELQRSSAPIAA